QAVAHRDRRRARVGHVHRDTERRDALDTAIAHRVVVGLDGADAADTGGEDATDPQRVVGQLALPAGLLDRLVRGDDTKLARAIEPPGLFGREEVLYLEFVGTAEAVLDPDDTGRPALVQRTRADAQRADRSDSGDYDSAFGRQGLFLPLSA